jgi:hypothetical protein
VVVSNKKVMLTSFLETGREARVFTNPLVPFSLDYSISYEFEERERERVTTAVR